MPITLTRYLELENKTFLKAWNIYRCIITRCLQTILLKIVTRSMNNQAGPTAPTLDQHCVSVPQLTNSRLDWSWNSHQEQLDLRVDHGKRETEVGFSIKPPQNWPYENTVPDHPQGNRLCSQGKITEGCWWSPPGAPSPRSNGRNFKAGETLRRKETAKAKLKSAEDKAATFPCGVAEDFTPNTEQGLRDRRRGWKMELGMWLVHSFVNCLPHKPEALGLISRAHTRNKQEEKRKNWCGGTHL